MGLMRHAGRWPEWPVGFRDGGGPGAPPAARGIARAADATAEDWWRDRAEMALFGQRTEGFGRVGFQRAVFVRHQPGKVAPGFLVSMQNPGAVGGQRGDTALASSAIEFWSSSADGFWPPRSLNPTVAPTESGDLAWTGKPKWICSSNFVG